MSELFLNAPENELIVESHFVLVKRPELSQKDKNFQTKATSLFGKWNEEKVQIFVFKCRGEKSKAVRKTNTQLKYT